MGQHDAAEALKPTITLEKRQTMVKMQINQLKIDPESKKALQTKVFGTDRSQSDQMILGKNPIQSLNENQLKLFQALLCLVDPKKTPENNPALILLLKSFTDTPNQEIADILRDRIKTANIDLNKIDPKSLQQMIELLQEVGHDPLDPQPDGETNLFTKLQESYPKLVWQHPTLPIPTKNPDLTQKILAALPEAISQQYSRSKNKLAHFIVGTQGASKELLATLRSNQPIDKKIAAIRTYMSDQKNTNKTAYAVIKKLMPKLDQLAPPPQLTTQNRP